MNSQIQPHAARTTIQMRVNRVASANHGVVTTQQLVQLGASSAWISRQVARGYLLRVARGTYFAGHARCDEVARTCAVTRALGLGSAIADRSAAFRWGVVRSSPRLVHVTVTSRRRPRPGTRIRVNPFLRPQDITTIDGIPVTTMERTVLDLSTTMPALRLANVIHEAQFRRVIDLGRLEELRIHDRRQRGCHVMTEALRIVSGGGAGTKSAAEEAAHTRVRAAGHTTAPNVDVEAPGGPPIQVDVWLAEHRIDLEVDGHGHERARTRAQDRERSLRLEAADVVVVRATTDEVWHDWPRVLARVEDAIATRIPFSR